IRHDLPDRLADLVGATPTTEPLVVAHRLAARVERHEGGRETVRQKCGDAADGGGVTIDIEERDVAFGRCVELQNSRNAEPALEGGPDVRPEPVAAGEPDAVRRLVANGRGLQQVAAQLADVLEEGAVPAGDVAPEPPGGEALGEHDRTAADQHRAGGQDAADAV